MGDNSDESLDESSDVSSYESDPTSEMDIEVQQVNRKQYHIATVVAALMVTNHVLKYIVKEKKTTSILSGHRWYTELITRNDNRFFEQLRMRKQVFRHLVCELTNNCGLELAKHIGVEESVRIFLYMIGQPSSYRNSQERFQHSSETIHEHFNKVLEAVCKLGKKIIEPVDLVDSSQYIRDDNRYWPYFKDCIGAIDGTHIKIHVPIEKQKLLFTRKGLTCKYYLVDSGYPSLKGFLASYKNARYYLAHFRLAPGFRSRNETFNYYHSSLRSVIERTFGVVKARWKVLQEMPNFKLQTQMAIIWACFALHKFLRRTDSSDLDILESLENINGLQDNEQDFHEGDANGNGVPTYSW
ncbi:uncharacterized protein LOC131639489 [Vicia villosa]|uniref:uncharacterized protein LOC131639489 n=1 Tax=Vicia villosa TaxID=3911 RepID=UPI00273ACDF4|nr:uncharacterized protein LOC131639489 [Vicia villosa]